MIFDISIYGKGPEQLARILEKKQIFTAKALYAKQKKKPLPERPSHLIDQSVVGILERQGFFSGLLFCADCVGKLPLPQARALRASRITTSAIIT